MPANDDGVKQAVDDVARPPELVDLDDVLGPGPNGSAGAVVIPLVSAGAGSSHGRGSAHAIPSDEIDELAAMDPDTLAYMRAKHRVAKGHDISPADVEHVVNARRMRGQELEFLTEAQLAALPDPDYAIDVFIPAHSIGVVFGQSQTFKSFVAIAMSVCLASAADFFGHRVSAASDVVYVAGEGLGGLTKRLAAFRQRHGISEGAGRIILVKMGAFDLRERGSVDALVAKIKREGIRPKLVVIDTLARAMPGTDEGAEDMSLCVAHMTRMRDALGATILALHHATKNGEWERGHSALRGGSDFMFETVRNGKRGIQLVCRKMKDDAEPGPFFVELTQMDAGTDRRGKPIKTLALTSVKLAKAEDRPAPSTLEDMALKALATFERGASHTQWLDKSRIAKTSFGRVRDALVKNGRVVCADGIYRLADEGLAQLGPNFGPNFLAAI